MAGYSHRGWACPFFRWDERERISCEGGRMDFPDRMALTEYADRYCANVQGWKSCTMAEGLLRYYERMD